MSHPNCANFISAFPPKIAVGYFCVFSVCFYCDRHGVLRTDDDRDVLMETVLQQQMRGSVEIRLSDIAH